LIGVGFILNSFQIVCNCYIGTTRIMVAQGLDGLLPDWFARVHPKWKTPVNAHIAYFLAALPVIWGFNKIGEWAHWTLGVTFANGAVMVLSALAAALLPYRAKALYHASPGAKYKVGNIPLVTILGTLGFLLGGFMVVSFVFVKDLGLAYAGNGTPYFIVIGTAVLGLAVYMIMKTVQSSKGVKVEYAFQEIPPE
jgi:basic amino acid/polyamine antiporter, APA family